MVKFKTLFLGFLAAISLLSSSLMPLAVQAASPDANYVIDGDNCVPFVPTAQCTANIHIDYNFLGGASGELLAQFNYKDGSKFDFININDPKDTIHVNYADPSHGTATINGKAKTITIGQTGNFTGFFVNGKPPESSKTATINVNTIVNFGKTDSNLNTGSVDISVRPDVAAASPTQTADGNPATLTDASPSYQTSFSPEGPGGYTICAKADFIKAPNNQVCVHKTKVAGTVLPVKLTAAGDPSKLDSVADKQDCDAGDQTVTWIVCGLIIKPITKTVDTMAGFISSLLLEEPLKAAGPVYNTWKAVRNIADVLFALAFMVIVFGAATGMGADAYAVKKMLPRLVAAAIFVQASFFLSQAAVDLGNITGLGVKDLFNHVLPGGGGLDFTVSSGAGITTIAASIGAALAVAGAAVGLSAVTLLAALIAILAVIFTLIVRKAFILMLVVVAPVAFVAWILPNTEKYFKTWMNNFIKLILMFPLVMGLFGMGKIFSAVAPSAFTGGVAWMGGVAAIIGYVMPLFLVPMMFKSAGGLMSFASGAVGGFAAGRAKALKSGKFAEKRAEERQRRNLDKATDPNAGFLKKAVASQRAGFGFRPTQIQQLKMQKAKEGMESQLRSGAAHQLRDLDAYSDTDALLGYANGGDAAMRKAAIDKLVKSGNYSALDKVNASSERAEVIRENAKDLITKAPQYLMTPQNLQKHFDGISASEIAALSKDGHAAYQTYLRTASPAGKINAEMQFRTMTAANVANLKAAERDVYDKEFGLEFAGSVSKAHVQALNENKLFDQVQAQAAAAATQNGQNGDDGGEDDGTPPVLPT